MPEKEERGKGSEAEELRQVLNVVKDFIPEILPHIKELLSTVLDTLSGEKLGEDVAAFYKKLIDSGMDRELAEKLTKEYLESKLDILEKGISKMARIEISPEGKGVKVVEKPEKNE